MKTAKHRTLSAAFRNLCSLLALLTGLHSVNEGAMGASEALRDVMPRVEDYTYTWWTDGFPAHTPSAKWLRCFQTGRFVMVLDTQSLRVPHFGPIPAGIPYLQGARLASNTWQNLPAAELALTLVANGKSYRCTTGGPWSDSKGPRLIESGRFLQRADVTDLVFKSDEGALLNVNARFETVAWPDRLSLILAATPAAAPIPGGEPCFGRVGGGFGLDGSNHLEVAHSPELDPEQFTLELWVFVPTDYRPSRQTFPWLACKNLHEEANGNYGLVLLNGHAQARLNIGGGRDHMFFLEAPQVLRLEAWNHLAMNYDGDSLRLFVNGEPAGERKIGRKRVPGHNGLAFGRRQDNCGDGYHFRGVLDEIRFYDRALSAAEIHGRFSRPEATPPGLKPVRYWSFAAEGEASAARPVEIWNKPAMEISLASGKHVWRQRWEWPSSEKWKGGEWHEVFLALDPSALRTADVSSPVVVQTHEIPSGGSRPVEFDPVRGWHRINLDGIAPMVPAGGPEKQNDAIERVKIVLANPTATNQTVRLLFEKTGSGFRQRFGSPITGLSAILRDAEGYPTGIPVQLSKNWHGRPESGVYAGTWFHGASQIHLPPNRKVELELTTAYGHWGGVAAASHAQLCLVGWGSNQLWDESALGSWGESICYEPDQAQAQAGILDVRPVMVRSMNNDLPWTWTHNVGGGDFFRLFDAAGQRVRPAGMRAAYARYGPCLTEVTYAGRIGEGMEHSATVSLTRTDDIVRGIYRLRLDVKKAVDFSRLVLFQIGADTYSYTGERKMALGNESGLTREWATQWGGEMYRGQPMECTGRVPWVSLHEAVSRANKEAASRGRSDGPGAWANRGFVIRSWGARLGGRKASPWLAEHGVRACGEDTSTADILPPPGVTQLKPGDFVEAVIEHVVMPQFAKDYYGPNEALRRALSQWENTWRMIHREALDNDRRVQMKTGSLESLYPAVTVKTKNGVADFTLAGGLGYVAVTFTGLASPRGPVLRVDGQPLDQSTHGHDFWQTDYDPASQRWSQTYNLPMDGARSRQIQLNPTL